MDCTKSEPDKTHFQPNWLPKSNNKLISTPNNDKHNNPIVDKNYWSKSMDQPIKDLLNCYNFYKLMNHESLGRYWYNLQSIAPSLSAWWWLGCWYIYLCIAQLSQSWFRGSLDRLLAVLGFSCKPHDLHKIYRIVNKHGW